MLDPALLRALEGASSVRVDAEVVAGFARDWTGRFVGSAPAVVSPASTDEVAAVVQICRDAGVAIVPQGGNTGLVGGGVSLSGEIVLSLRRIQGLSVDAPAGQVTAGAGTTLGDLQRAAVAAGWAYGVDLGSRDSATVGGTIATNAGGLRVLRHGDTRAQVMGVEAVLGDGSVVSHLGGLVKDNTGYHLPSLLCGSEGTLAVVTRARLRLVPPAPQQAVAILGMDSVGDVLQVVAHLRRTVPDLSAAELVAGPALGIVLEHTGMAEPLGRRRAVYLVVEVSGGGDPLGRLSDALALLGRVDDAAVASDPERARHLWRYREALAEAVNAVGIPHKLDVTLPLDAYEDFVTTVPDVVARRVPGARTWIFGHVAEGNVHVNVTGVDPDDEELDEAVLREVADRGGSISAEHGIGTAKRAFLSWARSESEIAAFRSIKAALDPGGVLNPNVLLP